MEMLAKSQDISSGMRKLANGVCQFGTKIAYVWVILLRSLATCSKQLNMGQIPIIATSLTNRLDSYSNAL
jgi:hypothetical protein